MNRIKLLDCTLRDGGLAIEDAIKNNINSVQFGSDKIQSIAQKLSDASIDIIELGTVEIGNEDKSAIAIFQTVEAVSRFLPQQRKKQQQFAALFRGPDVPIESIPEYKESLCGCIRVILRYSELKKSLEFCKHISKKGYKVFLQPMVTMRYTNDELQMIFDAANDMGAYAVYFVDSYGYMREQDVRNYCLLFNEKLDSSIHIGFHAHNNMNLAFSNVLAFIDQSEKYAPDRNIIVDSCIIGMGQGAGNLQTELIADHFNKYCDGQYDYDSILKTCEIIEKLNNPTLWGYSVTKLLSAINKSAYKFAEAFRNIYKLSFVDINYILANIPEEFRHRYTIDNTKKILSIFGFDSLLERSEQ